LSPHPSAGVLLDDRRALFGLLAEIEAPRLELLELPQIPAMR
jgi:hypothetical protein